MLRIKTLRIMFKSEKNKLHTATGKPAFWTRDLASYVKFLKFRSDLPQTPLKNPGTCNQTSTFLQTAIEILGHEEEELREMIDHSNIHILKGINSTRFKIIEASDKAYQLQEESNASLQHLLKELLAEYETTLYKMNVSLDMNSLNVKIQRPKALNECLKNIMSHILFRTFWVDTIKCYLKKENGEVILVIQDEGIYSESRQFLFNNQDKPCGYLNDASAFCNQFGGKLIVRSFISGGNVYLIRLTNIIK